MIQLHYEYGKSGGYIKLFVFSNIFLRLMYNLKVSCMNIWSSNPRPAEHIYILVLMKIEPLKIYEYMRDALLLLTTSRDGKII
ncbi:hypothetical protein Avbf_11715 [Armadillidium vulgare]|nr:hypothetical protein Avbf_11715 [Armadillidium vulgare]